MTFCALPAQAYFLQPYGALPTGLPSHSLGSAEAVRENCPQCDQPLVTLLSLDPADGRLELPALGGTHLHLCVCPRCHQSQYTIADDGEVIAVQGFQTSPPLFAVQLQPPEFRPVALHAVPDRIAEARTLAAEGRLDEAGMWASDYNWRTPTNQVGGQPAIGSGQMPSSACPFCGMAPPFLASLVCTAEVSGGEAGLAPIQVLFFVCRDCPAVIAITTGSAARE